MKGIVWVFHGAIRDAFHGNVRSFARSIKTNFKRAPTFFHLDFSIFSWCMIIRASVLTKSHVEILGIISWEKNLIWQFQNFPENGHKVIWFLSKVYTHLFLLIRTDFYRSNRKWSRKKFFGKIKITWSSESEAMISFNFDLFSSSDIFLFLSLN